MSKTDYVGIPPLAATDNRDAYMVAVLLELENFAKNHPEIGQQASKDPESYVPFDFKTFAREAPITATSIVGSRESLNRRYPSNQPIGKPSEVAVDPKLWTLTNSTVIDHEGDDVKAIKISYKIIIGLPYMRDLVNADMPEREFKSLLEHEHGHTQFLRDGNPALVLATLEMSPDPNFQRQKSIELFADRIASNPIERAGGLLRMAAVTLKYPNVTPANPYSFDSTAETHPNPRERTEQLLAQAYANDIFVNLQHGFSGQGKDYQFHVPLDPKTGLPITKTGELVTNWDEIKEAADDYIAEDMAKIDTFFKEIKRDDVDKIGFKSIDEIKTYLEARVKEFKEEYTIETQPLEKTEKLAALSNSFLHDPHETEVIAANLAKDSRMWFAYAALNLAQSEFSKLDKLDAEQRDQLTYLVKANIAKDINHNQFPALPIDHDHGIEIT